MLKPNLNELGKLAKDTHIETKKYFDKLKKKTPKNLDYVMQDLHDAEFKKTDCLECANCCKTTGPLFTSADIERISKSFRQKPQQFIEQYLRIDEDNDYVLQSVPCTFLDHENACMIYEVRPKVNTKKQLIRFVKQNKGKSGIVYCLSRKKVEEIAELLKVNDVKALPYHAGLDSHVRMHNQDALLCPKRR
jgi:Fe-S-cluster containining protein